MKQIYVKLEYKLKQVLWKVNRIGSVILYRKYNVFVLKRGKVALWSFVGCMDQWSLFYACG